MVDDLFLRMKVSAPKREDPYPFLSPADFQAVAKGHIILKIPSMVFEHGPFSYSCGFQLHQYFPSRQHGNEDAWQKSDQRNEKDNH